VRRLPVLRDEKQEPTLICIQYGTLKQRLSGGFEHVQASSFERIHQKTSPENHLKKKIKCSDKWE
jgi:hypothetical protein